MEIILEDYEVSIATFKFTYKSFEWIVKGEMSPEEERQYDDGCYNNKYEAKCFNLYDEYFAKK